MSARTLVLLALVGMAGRSHSHSASRLSGAGRGEDAMLTPRTPPEGCGDLDDPKETRMGFDQYHEPPEELSAEVRTFARLCASLTEEAEAIGWYEQRLSVEQDP